MQIQFVSSFAPIAPDPATSRTFYVDTFGLPLESHAGADYISSESIGGVKHFGVWPLSEAAQACYGVPDWPADVPIPQASVEFEVGNSAAVGGAARELVELGHTLLHDSREEPWGQTVARVLSPEHLIVGISYAPWMH